MTLQIHQAAVRHALERKLGIIHRTVPVNYAWKGELRKRYTDFQVYEIDMGGNVLHLRTTDIASKGATEKKDDGAKTATSFDEGMTAELAAWMIGSDNVEDGAAVLRAQQARAAATAAASTAPPSECPGVIPAKDQSLLVALMGQEAVGRLLALDQSILEAKRQGRTFKTGWVDLVDQGDRTIRSNIHQEVRRIFDSRIETQTRGASMISAIPSATSTGRGRGKARTGGGWRSAPAKTEKGEGQYLHFTLFKENKDTMEAVNTMARYLGLSAKNFGFSGTKDKRAATVQRMSVFRQNADTMMSLNQRLIGMKLGDFTYEKYPITLGQHRGNEFVITVKGCTVEGSEGCSTDRKVEMLEDCVRIALENTERNGFINYFGLQRFGTFTIGTHEIGMKILSGDFEGACRAILHFDASLLTEEKKPETSYEADEIRRARACSAFVLSGDARTALREMPRRYAAEATIIRHLCKPGGGRDFHGAILSITKGMRSMYLHAYQSFVWNWVATKRWAEYGTKVVAGDLVLMESDQTLMKTQGEHRGVEAADDEWPDEVDEFYVGARALTQEEAMSGQYTIRDIVLPTPGFAVIYPDNSIGDYYSEFMGRKENGGLDPYNMRRKVSALSLSGSYRKLIGGFIGSPTAKVRVYFDDNEQMHPTDLDIIKMEKSGEWSAAEQAAAAVWANLAQKADEEDRNITGQKRSREVAEDQTDGSKATASDTWLQTAADTDTKRVKVGEKKTNYRPPYVEDGSSASPGTIWDKDEPVSDATTLPQAAVVNKASATDVGEAAATTVSQAPSTVVNQDSLTPDPCASNRANQPSADEGPKLAVILSFKLHVSQYATVALRELMGTSP